MNLPWSQVIPKVGKTSPLANMWHSLSKPLEPIPWATSGSGSQLQRMMGMKRVGVKGGSHVMQSGLMVVPWSSPVCSSLMKGDTAVLSATVLVPRFPKQLSLVLVRKVGFHLPAGTKCKKRVLLPAHIFLHVVESPIITNHSQDLRNVMGKSVVFSAQATGTQPPSYQWEWKQATNDGKWWSCDVERFPAVDSATLIVPNVYESNEGSYPCVSNCAGSQTFNPAELSFGKNPIFIAYAMKCICCIMGILHTGNFHVFRSQVQPTKI